MKPNIVTRKPSTTPGGKAGHKSLPIRFSTLRQAVLLFFAFILSGAVFAQYEVGSAFECPLGACDANTGDEGGDHHNVVLEDHLAEARAQGNGAQNRSAFAEVGVRFRPCFTGPASIGMHDIDIDGHLRGFGGGPVIRGEVDVRSILRDITDDLELSNEVIFEDEERGQVGTTVNKNISVNRESIITANLVQNHTYDFVVRVNTRKFGLNGRSNFQTGDRGVAFDRVTIKPELPDTDGDGLFDIWEISGIDTDCDGDLEVDLPAMGADPNIKDLFLEIDWMTGQAPTQAAVRAVVQAFDLAPSNAGGVNTPNEGINLWVDTGNLTDPAASEDGAGLGTCGDGIDNGTDGADQFDTDCLVGALVFSSLPGGGNLGGGNAFPVSGIPSLNTDTDDDGTTDFEEAKFDPARGNFDPARLNAFRYAINAVPAGPPPNMGGQAGGNNFVLFNQNAGLLMHELGHTLGLGHGGPNDPDTDDDGINCKPNYVSVMNYRFQGGITTTNAGQDVDGDGAGDGFILDYSPPRFPNGRGLAPLTAIDETAWVEGTALDVSDSSNQFTWTQNNQALAPNTTLNIGPDWNVDGDTNDSAPPSIDFNNAFWNPAANESGAGGNSCGNGIDDDGDGQIDAQDSDCIGNTRCGPPNSNATAYNGANDWSNITLSPIRFWQTDEADIPGWFDEPGLHQIVFVQKSLQTTDLALTPKVAQPDPVVAGQELVYSTTVENRGPRSTAGAVLVDALPEYVQFVSGDPDCTVGNSGVVECPIGQLLPNESREVAIRTRVSVDLACAPGEQFAILANSAEVENRSGFDSNPQNNATLATSRVLCARYEYAAKFVCGTQDDPKDPRLATGVYRTTLNIHNPNDKPVFFFKKLALTFPPERQHPGNVVPIAIDELAYDQALKVDCSEVDKLIEPQGFASGYIEGYLVVQSPLSLDVDAVYTAQTLGDEGKGGSVSIDVEPIGERERKPGPLPDLVVDPVLPEPPFDEQFNFQLPEGVPGSLFCGPNGPNGGPSTTVEAVVTNQGAGDAGPSTLLVDFLSGADANVPIGAIASGQSITVSVPIPRGCYGPGESPCTFTLTADSPDAVNEEDENNNTAQSLCLAPAG